MMIQYPILIIFIVQFLGKESFIYHMMRSQNKAT